MYRQGKVRLRYKYTNLAVMILSVTRQSSKTMALDSFSKAYHTLGPYEYFAHMSECCWLC